MGLTSSQARMLLLTSRKSDLEYRSQMLSQRKLNIAMQTQELALSYSRATSNRSMNLVFNAGKDGTETVTEKLSYAGITGNNAKYVGNYIVKSASGKYVTNGKAEDMLRTMIKVLNTQLDENIVGTLNGALNEDGEPIFNMQQNEKGSYNELIFDEIYNKENPNAQAQFDSIYELFTSQLGNSFEFMEEIGNSNECFQDALRNGGLFLYKENDKQNDYDVVSWSSCGAIVDTLNTEDDAKAQAEYEAQSLVLSSQDKTIDLEIKQIETQHKAIETEHDSVKKVIEKNIELSYKTFA